MVSCCCCCCQKVTIWMRCAPFALTFFSISFFGKPWEVALAATSRFHKFWLNRKSVNLLSFVCLVRVQQQQHQHYVCTIKSLSVVECMRSGTCSLVYPILFCKNFSSHWIRAEQLSPFAQIIIGRALLRAQHFKFMNFATPIGVVIRAHFNI